MRPSRRQVLAAAAGAGLLGPVLAADPSGFRLGVLPFGTVSWEAEVIRSLRLDEAEGFRLEQVRLAGNDAARIAFLGGQVDAIVSDLLWAARLRNEGRAVHFLPFSATEGALMVPPETEISQLGDLKGKRIGIAGGALDKNWLLLRAAAEREGLDLPNAASIAYGAPPILAEKLQSGELDAALLYWTFCARLEARGFRRLIGADEIAGRFGVTDRLALLGYLVDEPQGGDRIRLIQGFLRASQAAKGELVSSDAAWALVRPLMEAPDEATFQALRRYFLDGIPRRAVAAERADAERLFEVLARVGGEKLVGRGASLPPGLYWDPPV
ncbi:ABC transporter substrate-binding protein [Enterovirga sp. CN4-39]|uniref:ABC transporter substrate-binding protein n=1 Tax=Enterovirga sp. CN4-39 TaxID=3400910 RepID=UPI003BFAB5B6